ncbi:hypothetical protein L1987_16562 [Smallanthus sonchifolius]|uniref:Uncharacterized protein n=1 Tax=Smallanthus sonchifolius TaxID=185202 RepID=A0ACB9IVJ3_9ASTR|nr:hypothetical protein L1987_16562 [Smallanthus sonchifolius]
MVQATRVDGNNEPNLVPIAPKKVVPGFNYSRAIHGGRDSPRQQPAPAPQQPVPAPYQGGKDSPNQQPAPPACPVPGAGSSDRSNDMGVDSASRFSILDIPNSIKFNKLITGQDDLYPPDQGLADSMDVEVNVLNNNGIYGISNAQKQVILNCMRDFKYVQAEAVEEWSQDVEDIDGFDLVHAVSHLKKLGAYVDPVVSNASNRVDVGLVVGVGLCGKEAEGYKQLEGHLFFVWDLRAWACFNLFLDSLNWPNLLVLFLMGRCPFVHYRRLATITFALIGCRGCGPSLGNYITGPTRWGIHQDGMLGNLMMLLNPREKASFRGCSYLSLLFCRDLDSVKLVVFKCLSYVFCDRWPTLGSVCMLGMVKGIRRALKVDRRTAGPKPSGQATNPIEVEMVVEDQARSSTELKDGDPNGMEEPNNTSGQERGPTMPIPPTGGPGKFIGDPPPAGAIDSLDSVMEGPIPTTSSAGYGMYSPRRDGSDFQSII